MSIYDIYHIKNFQPSCFYQNCEVTFIRNYDTIITISTDSSSFFAWQQGIVFSFCIFQNQVKSEIRDEIGL